MIRTISNLKPGPVTLALALVAALAVTAAAAPQLAKDDERDLTTDGRMLANAVTLTLSPATATAAPGSIAKLDVRVEAVALRAPITLDLRASESTGTLAPTLDATRVTVGPGRVGAATVSVPASAVGSFTIAVTATQAGRALLVASDEAVLAIGGSAWPAPGWGGCGAIAYGWSGCGAPAYGWGGCGAPAYGWGGCGSPWSANGWGGCGCAWNGYPGYAWNGYYGYPWSGGYGAPWAGCYAGWNGYAPWAPALLPALANLDLAKPLPVNAVVENGVLVVAVDANATEDGTPVVLARVPLSANATATTPYPFPAPANATAPPPGYAPPYAGQGPTPAKGSS